MKQKRREVGWDEEQWEVGDNVIVDVDVHGNDNVVDVNVERDGKGGHNLRNLGRKDGGK